MIRFRGYRRVLFLALACAALGGLCVALFLGRGGTVEWLPSPAQNQVSPQSTTAVLNPPPSLQTYAATWRTPLFNPARLPDAIPDEQKDNADGWVLSGIVTTPDLRLALFRQADGKVVKVAQGQQLPEGWQLEHLENRSVVLVRGAERQTVILPMIGKLPTKP